ncbi:MAG: flavin reductase family protein [Candidatus Margulisiibacteriota bacterium]
MSKQIWEPGNMLFPVPVVMVTCGTKPEDYNIITIAWAGTICSDPPMLSISVRPERHSYQLIKESKEFAVNLVTKKLVASADWCGVKSGSSFDKFKEKKLTPVKGAKVSCPLIEESPVNLECKVKKIIQLGTHDMFLADIVAVQINDQYLTPEGVLRMDKMDLVAYSHGFYYNLGKNLGKFGFSVQKKAKKKKK